jgi:hypothetical protein
MNEIQPQGNSFLVSLDEGSSFVFNISQVMDLKRNISKFLFQDAEFNRRIGNFTFQELKAIMRGMKTMYNIPLEPIDMDGYRLSCDELPSLHSFYERPSKFESMRKRQCI